MQRQTQNVDPREQNPEAVRMRQRLELAAMTIRKLKVPGVRPKDDKAYWPDVVRDYWEAYGTGSSMVPLDAPSARAIDDLDALCLLINKALDLNERKVVWARAFRKPWKVIQATHGFDRTTAWRIYTMAVMKLIACEQGFLKKMREETIVQRATPKVYAIRAVTLNVFKIGFSYTPEERLTSIQTGNPDKLELHSWVYGTQAQERLIHAHLSPHKMNGEWFRPEGLVLEAVKMMREVDHADKVLQHLEAMRRNILAA